ncbi:MAG: multidrug effflux MFS transporter, partial [Pseudomonadota bacterium]
TLLLVLIVSTSPLTMHIYLPSLPGMAIDLQATDAQLQLTLSVYLFTVANAQLIIGPLSDRFGRRRILLVGLLIFLLATLACRFATSIEGLIIARGFQAVGGCAGMVLGRAIVRDISTRQTAASLLGYVTMGMAVAQMMGPAIGGLLDGLYGWRASFDLLFALGLALLIACLVLLPETNLKPQTSFAPDALVRQHLDLGGQPRFWAFALTGALASAIFFAFLGGGPLIAQRELGLSPVTYGLYFGFLAGGYAIGNFFAGRYSEKVGGERMILIGNLLSLFAMATLALLFLVGFAHPLSLFAPMMLSSLANGLCLPNTFSGALSVRPDLAGTASGLAGWLQVMVGAAATVLVGWFIHLGIWPLIVIMLLLSIAALLAGTASGRLERQFVGRESEPITQD